MKLVTTREAAQLCGIGTNTLQKRLERGNFPTPDVPGVGRGGRNRWRAETVWRYLALAKYGKLRA